MPSVRIPMWLGVVACSLLAGSWLTPGTRWAVSEEQPVARHCDVAVIDVSRVFEKSESFQKQMQAIVGKVNDFEVELLAMKQEIASGERVLAKLPKAGEEHAQLSATLAEQRKNVEDSMKSRREEFLQEEGAIYLAWYRKMEEAVRAVAIKQELRLVLRTTNDAMREGDRASILQGVNRPIVYEDRLNITDEVIKRLNEA